MPCYYCGEAFVDKDIVVELPLKKMERQEHGGVIATEQETVLIHQQCLGDPDA
jgi:hypothetical protein